MIRNSLLWIAVFAITVAETLIATWEGRADRRSTTARTNKWSLRSSHWAALFELVLFLDVYLIVTEGWHVIFPILAGAWLGKYWSLERRRAKFRRNAANPPRRKPKQPVAAEPVTEPS
jgi:hypothetical protein